MKNEFNDMLQGCLCNKSSGSIAKYWRERLRAVKDDVPDTEFRQIVAAMRAEATEEFETGIPGASTLLEFEDHSAALVVPGPRGRVFICINYHLIIV